MSTKYNILFFPVDGVGHFNACIGIASALRDRGHKVTFAAPSHWKGKLRCQGFHEEIYQMEEHPTTEISSEKWGDKIREVAPIFCEPSIEVHDSFYVPMWFEVFRWVKFAHPRFVEIYNSVKPDVIVLDAFFHIPAFMDQDVPFISSISVTPLSNSRVNVPPPYSGYPTEGDQNTWKVWDQKIDELYSEFSHEFNQWLLSLGSNPIKFRFPYMQNISRYANMYMYPMELDYTPFRPNPPNFYQFDCYFGSSEVNGEKFQIHQVLKPGPGKLIYFSMGTIGCQDISLMNRLIGILSKSPHRFIVSKGPLGDQIQLGNNMWGANSLPQKSVLPLVDLVITHGGNNTITESFYYGKRVLVLPLLFDQVDNAQRIYETGLGLQFHPYKVTKEELLNGIEKLLGDELLQKRMDTISKRIQAANGQNRAADLVEEIARKYKGKKKESIN